MRRSFEGRWCVLTAGLIGLLLTGIAPAPSVLAWHLAGPVCHGSCAGKSHCCCKARWNHRHERGRRVATAVILRGDRDCCSRECTEVDPAVPTTTRGASHRVVQFPGPEAANLLRLPDAPLAAPSDSFAPARPRAPPLV